MSGTEISLTFFKSRLGITHEWQKWLHEDLGSILDHEAGTGGTELRERVYRTEESDERYYQVAFWEKNLTHSLSQNVCASICLSQAFQLYRKLWSALLKRKEKEKNDFKLRGSNLEKKR